MRYATTYGAFQIDPVPAQPQIGHCHGFFVTPAFRGQGKAVELKKEQATQLKLNHYDFATATVDSANLAMKKVMEKSGWFLLTSFKNSKTGGSTELWGLHVQEEPREATCLTCCNSACSLRGEDNGLLCKDWSYE